MNISELINYLEEFKYDFGDVEVILNRNGREYPVYMTVTGTYPAYKNDNRSSGYFVYTDDEEAEEEGITEKDTNACVLND